MDQRPIGIFDSGVGGLTVLSEIAKRLPSENLIYFGDTARNPYGPKSRDTIVQYARQISHFLLQRDVKMIIVACNTATALSLDVLQNELNVPVLGVIDPAVNALSGYFQSGYNRVGIIGTRSTIRSRMYEIKINEVYGNNGLVQIYQKACPLFVSLVEEGWADKNISRLVAHEYLDELVREEVEILILGCTHYPLLKNMLGQEFPGFIMIDGAIETAKEVEQYLLDKKMQRKSGKGRVEIYITDVTDYFQTLEKLFYGGEIASVRDVKLDQLRQFVRV